MTKLDKYIHVWRKEDYEVSHECEDEYGNVLFWSYSPSTHTYGTLYVRVDPVQIRERQTATYEQQEDAPEILKWMEERIRNNLKREFVKLALEEMTHQAPERSFYGFPLTVCYSLPENTMVVSPDIYCQLAERFVSQNHFLGVKD